ncbi:MAG TPA: hypothetical protein VLY24_10085 [Bryobacteraceae bacterium]|nr:hypothetical protein [Bryobacteraceae bacterium]
MDIVSFVIAYMALCVVAGFAGRHRRIGFWGFLFFSVLITPILGLLFMYFAAPRKV